LLSLGYAAAGVATVACDLDDALVIGFFAMIAAVVIVSAHRALTAAVRTSVIVICHLV
jgi:hypothetical protein